MAGFFCFLLGVLCGVYMMYWRNITRKPEVISLCPHNNERDDCPVCRHH